MTVVEPVGCSCLDTRNSFVVWDYVPPMVDAHSCQNTMWETHSDVPKKMINSGSVKCGSVTFSVSDINNVAFTKTLDLCPKFDIY